MRENLRKARKEKGMTQQQVADRLEMLSVNFKCVCKGAFIVCADGKIFKRYKDGLYRITPNTPSTADGYIHLSMVEDGKVKQFLAHRLIAEALIPNSENYPVVNHKDANRMNNNIENLEWCSQADNIRHSVNMHKQKYFTKLKQRRISSGITTNKLARKIGLMIGVYRNIENAVKKPTENEIQKLEDYFGEKIEDLLAEVTEVEVCAKR